MWSAACKCRGQHRHALSYDAFANDFPISSIDKLGTETGASFSLSPSLFLEFGIEKCMYIYLSIYLIGVSTIESELLLLVPALFNAFQ